MHVPVLLTSVICVEEAYSMYALTSTHLEEHPQLDFVVFARGM